MSRWPQTLMIQRDVGRSHAVVANRTRWYDANHAYDRRRQRAAGSEATMTMINLVTVRVLQFSATRQHGYDLLSTSSGTWRGRGALRAAMEVLLPQYAMAIIDSQDDPREPTLPTPTDVPVPEPTDVPVPEPTDVPPPVPHDVPPPPPTDPGEDPLPRPIP